MRSKIALILGLALASSAAMANNIGSDTKAKTFSDLDTDGNGKLSQMEASANAKIVFATADTNGDGALSQTEYEAAVKADTDAGLNY